MMTVQWCVVSVHGSDVMVVCPNSGTQHNLERASMQPCAASGGLGVTWTKYVNGCMLVLMLHYAGIAAGGPARLLLPRS